MEGEWVGGRKDGYGFSCVPTEKVLGPQGRSIHQKVRQRCVSDIRTLMRWPTKPTLSINQEMLQLEQPMNELCSSFFYVAETP